MSHSFSLVLKSEYGEVEKSEALIDRIDRQVGLDENLKERMMLVLNEAVTNAIVHGNREERLKKVFIEIVVREKSVVMTIEDQGEGFNPEDVPDPLKRENLLKPVGRGLFLMEEYCDRIDWDNEGRKVKIHFDRLANR